MLRVGRVELGMGCYWCAEKLFARQPGVVAACVGFAGGDAGDPNEVVQVEYDPCQVHHSRNHV
jgi:peptide methionine sulfoxide reductase MsrA